MREYTAPALFLLFLPIFGQTVPTGWKVVKDSKGTCQVAVPAEWVPLGENSGAAVFHDATTAVAAVTSQPGQTFKPLTDALMKLLAIRKERLFENTAKRTFYQDKTSRNSEDQNGYTASVPGKGGTCSCRVAFVPGISAETAKKIALSLSPVEQ